ncbi:hypothetical protein PXK30_21825 [Phaeobacter gallaeciensis]|uniref:hypothetical protein n=1 Tax=Phaeobacter gallaeciensis TaxID=60890 RepID=UPI00237F5CE3|nr:hypothetical protein [Phaeobacter gallaeciensis]MDE4306280.1 hypothetical protein [Phaeobacter gallaeciensis]MDE4310746.1 hypothetical protein [Phaeobacter gallaeciensis]MDE4315167.1 hypothetical protein [Phaeobacter gallaeciensis]MDE4319648.1 hypothetical protein [Phaeobacter gallaeciensis]MDE4324076.1 hypothetical protein [Phaeobacter gallaeciensis]
MFKLFEGFLPAQFGTAIGCGREATLAACGNLRSLLTLALSARISKGLTGLIFQALMTGSTLGMTGDTLRGDWRFSADPRKIRPLKGRVRALAPDCMGKCRNLYTCGE